jgi:hypothetical protein
MPRPFVAGFRPPLALLLLAGTLLPGCSREDGPKLAAVAPEAFRTDATLFVTPDRPAPLPLAQIAGVRRAEPEELGAGLDRVAVIVGAPAVGASGTATSVALPASTVSPGATGASASSASAAVTADVLVGQINGKPVFASEILDPLDGKMRADLKKFPEPNAWLNEQSRSIQGRLFDRVRSELILAEARARLTPEERVGLTTLLSRIQSFTVAQAGGSLEQARADIERRSGETSLDRFLADERDQILIQRTLKEQIEPRVRIPWSAVERYYRENQAQFQPAGDAVYRIVVISAAERESLAAAAAAAQSDDAFKAFAATEANRFLQESAGERRFPLDKPTSQWQLINSREINAAAVALAPGQSVGPLDFMLGERKVWIRRQADDVRPGRTLEEAQVDIIRELTTRKLQAETSEFLTGVLGDSSFTPLERMGTDLVALAAERHLAPEWAARVRSTLGKP